mmetsp:Transcript_7636/g.11333  ORF Transcript_7636/g.11333 Transcript_7636/m.11333 type:complete len:119 (-) Transcript_7636:146-502(-)
MLWIYRNASIQLLLMDSRMMRTTFTAAASSCRGSLNTPSPPFSNVTSYSIYKIRALIRTKSIFLIFNGSTFFTGFLNAYVFSSKVLDENTNTNKTSGLIPSGTYQDMRFGRNYQNTKG